MKILLVDDDKETTSMLSEFFDSKGYPTVVTNDPMEGLGLIQQEQYDVILLDINMSVISGVSIIQLLATDEILKDQNIFIISEVDYHENQIKAWLRRDGVNGFLKKPIEPDKLLTTITSC